MDDKFGDPGFHYHAAAARLLGLMTMRLASAEIVPLRFSSYAASLQEDLDAMRRDAIRRARTNAEGQKPAITPDFSEVLAALKELATAGEAADRAIEAVAKSGDAASMRRINDSLVQVERAFLDAKGLPNRSWFRHMLIAPGLTTGYAPWPFPAMQEAIEARDAGMFAAEAKRVAAAIRAGAAKLQQVR